MSGQVVYSWMASKSLHLFLRTFCRVPHTGGGCCRENYLYRVGLWQSQRLDTLLGWITDIPSRLSSYRWAAVLRPTTAVLRRQGGIYICQAFLQQSKGPESRKGFLWSQRLHIRLISQSPREKATCASKRAADQIASLCHGLVCPHVNEVSCIHLDGKKKKKNPARIYENYCRGKKHSVLKGHRCLPHAVRVKYLALPRVGGNCRTFKVCHHTAGFGSGDYCEKSAGVPLIYTSRCLINQMIKIPCRCRLPGHTMQ